MTTCAGKTEKARAKIIGENTINISFPKYIDNILYNLYVMQKENAPSFFIKKKDWGRVTSPTPAN
jgi:hypothetical protein